MRRAEATVVIRVAAFAGSAEHCRPMPARPLPAASRRDSLAFLVRVVGPDVAKGPILRRPRMVALAERLELDRQAVRRMQRLHERYGPGP